MHGIRPMSMGTAARLGALYIALSLSACNAPIADHQLFVVDLHALSTTREAIADARFWADGRELGTSDGHGTLRAQLTGRDGQVVALSAACPPAYRTLTQSRRIVLRRLAGRAAASSVFELTIECQPLERLAALVVRARGADVAGLPIRLGGETIGQTELDGTAHLLVRAHPHSSLRVEIATAAHPDLLPRDPVHTFQLEDDDSILLIDQAFTEPSPKRAQPPRRWPLAGSSHRPYRIASH